jgi:two-component system sensor histidine kinase UhpB
MSRQDRTPSRRSAALTSAQERERSRIARALHDDVGQAMSAAGLQLDLLRMDIADRFPEIGVRTAEIQRMLERAMSRVRELITELGPGVTKEAAKRAQAPD